MIASVSPMIVRKKDSCSRKPRSAARRAPPGSVHAARLRAPLTGILIIGYHGGMYVGRPKALIVRGPRNAVVTDRC